MKGAMQGVNSSFGLKVSRNSKYGQINILKKLLALYLFVLNFSNGVRYFSGILHLKKKKSSGFFSHPSLFIGLVSYHEQYEKSKRYDTER